MVDLLVLDMIEFDIILGMDWLTVYHATDDCQTRVVTFRPPNKPSWDCTGCQGFLLSLISDDGSSSSQLSDAPVVREYLDVLPDELPGLPPRRQVKFTIELIPGSAPTSKAPYRMTPKELDELKVQLQE
ncbi:uncharacterized protein LOC141842849 [Curcuma longa]|uniref:uncharacterized protein LOC141842849 n=1 Tax=Curcuma longa TaxID=136217 RepID=UPI003D9EE711